MSESRDMTYAERNWIARLQRTLDAKPRSLVIYCHGDTATVLDRFALTEEADRDTRAAILDDAPSIKTHGWIAGDF